MFPTSQLKNILYIEDDAGLARLLQLRMERFGYKVDIAVTGEEGIEKYRNNQYDIILIDNYLPGVSGIDVLKELNLTEFDTPAIFLTSSGDEKLAIDALRANAADYLIKDASQTYLELLPSVMASAYTRVELLKQNKLQEETLRGYAEQLVISQQRLNSALEGTDTGVWDWNIETGELFWSQNLKQSLELPEGQEPSIEYWMKRVHPDDREKLNRAINEHITGKSDSYHCIFREKAQSGSGREWNWILARGLVQKDSAGKPKRVIGTSSDFTIHKQMEEQLQDAKTKAEAASKTKSEFLAMMSHEIRTPMNAIIGLADILSKSKLDERQKEIIETMKTSSATLLTLINDLLDISRIEANQLELENLPFDMGALINEITQMLMVNAQSKGLEFKVDTSDIVGKEFLGDKHRIKQIITNLCGNALKFTDEGKIFVSAHYTLLDNNVYHIAINVTDSGIGIPKDKLNSIFEKFVQADQSITRRFGGTGLGLAISHSLAIQMGGHISVESEEGKGSTFVLFLPLKLAGDDNTKLEYSETPDQVLDTNSENKKIKILLVEDYAPNVLVATLLIENMGYEYEVANNGIEAVNAVKNAPDSYDIILMDVQMHEMDGFEATRTIRKLESENGWKKHKIIGLTAHALAGDRERCLAAGMNEYITKPINSQELAAKVSSLLKS